MRRRRAARRARAIEAAQCAPSSSPNPRWRTVRGSSRERVLLLLRGVAKEERRRAAKGIAAAQALGLALPSSRLRDGVPLHTHNCIIAAAARADGRPPNGAVFQGAHMH